MKNIYIYIFFVVIFFSSQKMDKIILNHQTKIESPSIKLSNSVSKTFGEKLSDAAISIIDPKIVYTPSYVVIKYPNGDVPLKTGVCTDVVIRAYRKLGIDLQKEVHVDMKNYFSKYPKIWGLKTTDTNIDHRRVPNLETFFSRNGKKLPISSNPKDYQPGDIVTWRLVDNGIPHIGIVTNIKSEDGKQNKIVHNIGYGQILEDCLFNYKIVGHYTYEK